MIATQTIFKNSKGMAVVIGNWILRGTVSFVFLLLVTKIMGQRSISQLRFLDFIIALTLGNIIAHPLSDEGLGLKGSMITTIVLIVLYVSATWLSLKWPFFKRYLDPSPITLINKPTNANICEVILATVTDNENAGLFRIKDEEASLVIKA